jgi:branched-chain amino acid transport system substrate-binding protein
VKFAETDSDLSSQVAEIQNADVDAVAVSSLMRGGALFTKQGREKGLTMPLVAPNSWVSDDFLDLAGTNATDVYASADFISDPEQNSPLGQEFIKRYEEKYDEAPNSFAADGFDQMMMLAKAVEETGSTDAVDIRDAFKTIEIDGITGKRLRFGDDRSILKDTIKAVVKDNAWVLFE